MSLLAATCGMITGGVGAKVKYSSNTSRSLGFLYHFSSLSVRDEYLEGRCGSRLPRVVVDGEALARVPMSFGGARLNSSANAAVILGIIAPVFILSAL